MNFGRTPIFMNYRFLHQNKLRFWKAHDSVINLTSFVHYFSDQVVRWTFIGARDVLSDFENQENSFVN